MSQGKNFKMNYVYGIIAFGLGIASYVYLRQYFSKPTYIYKVTPEQWDMIEQISFLSGKNPTTIIEELFYSRGYEPGEG